MTLLDQSLDGVGRCGVSGTENGNDSAVVGDVDSLTLLGATNITTEFVTELSDAKRRHDPIVATLWRRSSSLSCTSLFEQLHYVDLLILFRGTWQQAVGVKEVESGIWLVSFMDYDLSYVDPEEKTLQPIENPFGPKVLPMS